LKHKLEHILNVVAEPENRMAYVISPIYIAMGYKQAYRYGVSSLHEANEDVSTLYLGYVMHIALKDIVTLKAAHYFESGIAMQNFKTNGRLEGFKLKPQAIGPQVLTLRHLEAGFVVIVVLLGLSCVAFAVELLPTLMRKLKKMIDMSVACYVVVKFTRMNKMY
jgi:hypothetical protein